MNSHSTSFQLGSTIHVEVLDRHSLAVYDETMNTTQIIDASFHWLLALLTFPTSYSEIKNSFITVYDETPSGEISEQLDELLNTFLQNKLINKVD